MHYSELYQSVARYFVLHVSIFLIEITQPLIDPFQLPRKDFDPTAGFFAFVSDRMRQSFNRLPASKGLISGYLRH